MEYKRMKFNHVVNMEKMIGEINDIQFPPPYDNDFKQLVFNDEKAREEFLKLADFVAECEQLYDIKVVYGDNVKIKHVKKLRKKLKGELYDKR